MGFRVIEGNIFTTEQQTLVNTVNCVGVMGAGIALEFRLRYPDMYRRYVEICKKGQLDIGKLWLVRTPGRWVLNFPTKKHWRYPSKEAYLRQGLEKLAASYAQKGIYSIAMPLLGADRGGIDPEVSLALIREYLGVGCDDLDVAVYRYDPAAKDDLFETFKIRLLSDSSEKIISASGLKASALDKLRNALEQESICQLNQMLQVKGIGLVTLEKAFHYVQSPTADAPDLFMSGFSSAP
ncbi:macro domain-containing protein [Halomonas qaidamensis]|uniref:Macro domain-containing protein n=1 Tax=Halomonas qaidamensis TaxID=2866211 RepID=A0ABY6JQP3_9GAMM|nr:macro domain-containing protein [Halomonas qaidamensis]UYV19475.1 macro domain-containing protein [Halomonas qaidamensis]